jgi:hypothetical protein
VVTSATAKIGITRYFENLHTWQAFIINAGDAYNHSLQPTTHNDNVNQFKVGLESDKGYFTLKVKAMTLMSHFFCPQ